MAHLTQPHACGNFPSLTPALRAGRVYDAVDDILPRVMALEAVEQLMTAWKAGTKEDLADVTREGLAWLLNIVNNDLRRHVERAKAVAHEAIDAAQEGGAQ